MRITEHPRRHRTAHARGPGSHRHTWAATPASAGRTRSCPTAINPDDETTEAFSLRYTDGVASASGSVWVADQDWGQQLRMDPGGVSGR
jgi:hypothetical protein